MGSTLTCGIARLNSPGIMGGMRSAHSSQGMVEGVSACLQADHLLTPSRGRRHGNPRTALSGRQCKRDSRAAERRPKRLNRGRGTSELSASVAVRGCIVALVFFYLLHQKIADHGHPFRPS